MFNNNQIQKVEINQESKKLYIHYKQDNSHLTSNPPPPPSYFREVYKFESLEFVEKEYATVERAYEKIKYKDEIEPTVGNPINITTGDITLLSSVAGSDSLNGVHFILNDGMPRVPIIPNQR